MNKIIFVPVLSVVTALATVAVAQSVKLEPRPLRGTYFIFGGELTEETQPKVRDAKISFTVTGQAASDMFRLMGASAKSRSCDNDGTEELRTRGDLQCTRIIKTGAIECNFGLDLPTGKARLGQVC